VAQIKRVSGSWLSQLCKYDNQIGSIHCIHSPFLRFFTRKSFRGEDTIQIICPNTGDLLVNLNGTKKKAYSGEIRFRESNRNHLVEMRGSEIDKGTVTKTRLRAWDLGFSADGDSDDDEEEHVIFEAERPGPGCFVLVEPSRTSSANHFVVASWAGLRGVGGRGLEWFYPFRGNEAAKQAVDSCTGALQSMLPFDEKQTDASTTGEEAPCPCGASSSSQTRRFLPLKEYCGAIALSKCGSRLAVAHFGSCSVRDSCSGVEILRCYSPVPDDKVYLDHLITL
jgi:hypothetical protein